MTKFDSSGLLFAALVCLDLVGCSPAHDWREVHGSAAPFTVLMPAKPATLARKIDLNGTALTMTMVAAEIDGVAYAVGSVELPDPVQAKQAMQAMQTAMLKNIQGKVIRQQAAEHRSSAAGEVHTDSSIDLEALGTPPNGRTRLLLARFVAHDRNAYQAVVTGAQKSVAREQAETFLTSFKVP